MPVDKPRPAGSGAVAGLPQQTPSLLSMRSPYSGALLLHTPVPGRSSWTSRAAVQSPARAATTDPDSLLSMSFDSGTGELATRLGDLHGDIIGIITGTTTPEIQATYETDEYGVPHDSADVGDVRYGYLGQHQRATDNPAGISLMSVRLYNAATGRFLTVDPVPGGSANDYDYANQNPVTNFDLNGKWCVAQVGTTCTRYPKDKYGRYVPVSYSARNKMLTKHGITWSTLQWLISRLSQREAQKLAVVYGDTVFEYRCTTSWFTTTCNRTGRSVYVKMVVEFKSMNGKTFGLVTAHCIGSTLCPKWINYDLKI